MKDFKLLCSNDVILEDERVMKLDYCLTEQVMEEQGMPYYGIRIIKHLDDLVESEEELGVSTSKEIVVSIIKKLCEFKVTPVSMIEIVDDLITQGELVY